MHQKNDISQVIYDHCKNQVYDYNIFKVKIILKTGQQVFKMLRTQTGSLSTP